MRSWAARAFDRDMGRTEGEDVAPLDDRRTEYNKFCERMIFEPIGQVRNHEQTLYGLRYATMAWRLGENDPMHEEVGYWLWDPTAKQVLRCFIVPRGVALIAGGTVEPGASSFTLVAEASSGTYGTCSNQFLDKEFKTVRYELTVTMLHATSFTTKKTASSACPAQTCSIIPMRMYWHASRTPQAPLPIPPRYAERHRALPRPQRQSH